MERMEHVLDQTYKQLVESRKKLVLEQVITSIASVADAAQDHFVQFYERLMPPLKFILQVCNRSEESHLIQERQLSDASEFRCPIPSVAHRVRYRKRSRSGVGSVDIRYRKP